MSRWLLPLATAWLLHASLAPVEQTLRLCACGGLTRRSASHRKDPALLVAVITAAAGRLFANLLQFGRHMCATLWHLLQLYARRLRAHQATGGHLTCWWCPAMSVAHAAGCRQGRPPNPGSRRTPSLRSINLWRR